MKWPRRSKRLLAAEWTSYREYAFSRGRCPECADQYKDAAIAEDNIRLIKETREYLGGIDVIIANASWTRFSEFGNLNDLSYEEWNKVPDVSGLSL